MRAAPVASRVAASNTLHAALELGTRPLGTDLINHVVLICNAGFSTVSRSLNGRMGSKRLVLLSIGVTLLLLRFCKAQIVPGVRDAIPQCLFVLQCRQHFRLKASLQYFTFLLLTHWRQPGRLQNPVLTCIWMIPQVNVALEVLGTQLSPTGTTVYGQPRSFQGTIINIGTASSITGDLTFVAGGVPICTAPLLPNNTLVGTTVCTPAHQWPVLTVATSPIAHFKTMYWCTSPSCPPPIL